VKPPKRLFRDVHRNRDQEPAAGGYVPPPAAKVWPRWIVSVPFHTFIDPSCDHCLRELERLGIKVSRSVGASAIDITRNLLASEALDAGYESLLFIDADIAFHPEDVVKILKRPEAVVAGVYASKVIGRGQINARFGAVEGKVRFGEWADRLYPLEAVGAGFLRIKTDVLRQMIQKLELPVCRMAGRYGWPFFLPVVVEEEGEVRYLGEDYSFIWRCRQIGIVPLADTSIRLMHMGSYPYGWEEAGGAYVGRHRNLECDFRSPHPTAPAPNGSNTDGRQDPE
jgi:hypothetical protein